MKKWKTFNILTRNCYINFFVTNNKNNINKLLI